MSRLIQKSGFIKPGKAVGYMKYIATRERVEKQEGSGPATESQKKLIAQLLKDFPDAQDLFEYEDYLASPTAANASAFLTMALDAHANETLDRSGYLRYMGTRTRAERHGEHGLFSSAASVSMDTALKEVEAHTGNVWTLIYSLRRPDAARLGYDHAEGWRTLLMGKQAELATALKIQPDHLRWYAAFHDEGEHPHIHVMAWSSDPKESFLTKDALLDFQSKLTNEIFRGELQELYVLTGAINRVVEDMNHRFVLKVLTKGFESADLGLTARNLRKERDPEKRTAILDQIDTAAVTERLMRILDIRNRDAQTVGLTDTHIREIKDYLKALDLILDCPTEYAEPGIEPEEHILFTQPGMRYCQAVALVHSLMKDNLFRPLSEADRGYVTERLLGEVRGRMLEDILLLETQKALDAKRYRVFKLRFQRGEFDMVIYDSEENRCAAFEVKHSGEAVPEQARHLMDEEKVSLLRARFGEVAERAVLYLGEPREADGGIVCRNAEQYLKNLPEQAAQILAQARQDDIEQAFTQTI